LVLPLIACTHGGSLATFQAGDAPLAVKLPTVCESFLQPVAVPPVTRKTDARAAYTRSADALDEANARLSIGGDCAKDERAAYAHGSVK
jgi:hypothetical protein